MMMNPLAAASVLAMLFVSGRAFVASPSANPRLDTTRLFLEDHIADLIDRELYRQAHKKEFEILFKRKKVLLSMNYQNYLKLRVHLFHLCGRSNGAAFLSSSYPLALFPPC